MYPEQPTRSTRPKKAGLWKYIAPISLGAAYAISRILMLHITDAETALQENFKYLFLAGVLIAFALRPIALLIYWKPATGITVITVMLFTLGTPGKILDSLAWGAPVISEFWQSGFAEMFAFIFITVVATFLLPPSNAVVDFALIQKRFLRYITPTRTLIIFLSGGVYVLLFLLTQVCFTPDIESFEPLQKLNEFFSLPQISPLEQIAFLWLRGILCTVLVILPVLILFSRGTLDLILILGSLMFVVSEFAPAFVRFQHYASLMLIDQVIQGAFLYFLFASIVIFGLKRE